MEQKHITYIVAGIILAPRVANMAGKSEADVDQQIQDAITLARKLGRALNPPPPTETIASGSYDSLDNEYGNPLQERNW